MKKLFKETFSSLKTRNYRLYFIGQAISLCGTWMQTIGQSWLVLKITGSGTQLGLVTAFQFLPILLFGPWGGIIADRFPKRKLLYFTQSAAGVLALTLGILIATGTVRLWMIYLLALGLGFINSADQPTRQTFIIEMVGKKQLKNAISLNSVENNMARLIGPAIGGILIAAVGLASLFVINAISYIAVLIALSMMRLEEMEHRPAVVPSAKGQLRDGFNYIRSSPVLRDILLMGAIVGTLSYEFTVVLPLFARFTIHGDVQSYASLMSSMGAGSIIGGLFAANRKQTSPHLLIRAALFFGGSILIAAIAPNLILSMLALMLVGALSINFLTLTNVIVQLESSHEMRGRVMAFLNMAFLGSTPIGGPIIGWISEYASPRWGLATGGLAAIFAAGLGAIALVKRQSILIPSEVEAGAEAAVEQETRNR